MSFDLEKEMKQSLVNMAQVANQVYAPKPPKAVRILACPYCWRGYKDNGDKCFNCAGLGRVATDGGEV